MPTFVHIFSLVVFGVKNSDFPKKGEKSRHFFPLFPVIIDLKRKTKWGILKGILENSRVDIFSLKLANLAELHKNKATVSFKLVSGRNGLNGVLRYIWPNAIYPKSYSYMAKNNYLYGYLHLPYGNLKKIGSYHDYRSRPIRT